MIKREKSKQKALTNTLSKCIQHSTKDRHSPTIKRSQITIAEFIFLCEEPRVDDVESCERYSGRAAKEALLHVAQLGNQRPVPRMRKVVSAITAGLIK